MLSAKNITVRKGRAGKMTALLDDVSVTLEAGRIAVIIGPNGAGKSTLMRCLLGDEEPETGTVSLDGRPLEAWNRRALSHRLAYLPQAQDLQFPFTAREVVLMGRSSHYRFIEREEDLLAAETALERLDLHNFADRNYMTLSGGERQRVNLARVLAQLNLLNDVDKTDPNAPQFLLLDEPNNNLDIRHQLEVLGVAQEMRERGLGVVAVLHDLNQASNLADDLLVMHRGRLFAAGPPEEVLSQETIRTVFGVELSLGSAKDFSLPQPSSLSA